MYKRLTDNQVRELRERRAGGETYAALSEEYGVTPQTALKLSLGHSRPEAGGPISEKAHELYERKLTDDQVRECRRLYFSGERSAASLYREHGIHKDNFLDMLHGRTYKDV
jgi:hypothetical protein